MENKIKAMELMKESSNVESDYGKGVYNGIELCLALYKIGRLTFLMLVIIK